MELPESKVIIGLTDPKSPSNVGAVMRAAGCYQADEVRYTGVRYARAAKFHTDTKDVSRTIPLNAAESLIDDISTDQKVVCVDLIEGATPLPEFVHPENAIYIFGPEDGTISQTVINRADAVVYVPTVGCMNLAASVNVLLYDRLAKSSTMIANDALIKRSRDTNNTVRVTSN